MEQVRVAISGAHGSGKTYIVEKLKEYFEGLGLKVVITASSTRALKQLGFGINTNGCWETQFFSAANRVQRQLEASQSGADLVLGDRCVGDELAYNNWHIMFVGDGEGKELWFSSDLITDLFEKDISQYWDAVLWKRPHPDYLPVDDGDRSSSPLYQEQIDGRFKAIYQPESNDRLHGIEKISTLPVDRDEAFEVAKYMIFDALYAKGLLPDGVVNTLRSSNLGGGDMGDGYFGSPTYAPVSTVQDSIRLVLQLNGEDPQREGLRETPDRVARMYTELFSGLSEDPSVHLKKTFETDSSSMVIVKDIAFTSLCEHHLLPFSGVVHIGYIPGKISEEPGAVKKYRIAGLSKFGRVVDGFSRRPQVQEQLTHQIARCIQSELHPQGVIVVVEAEHSCMSIRGVKKSGAATLTSSVTGIFDKNTDNVKGEFFSILGLSK